MGTGLRTNQVKTESEIGKTLQFLQSSFTDQVLLSKMSRHRDWDVTRKVYIGNLGNNASKYDLEDAFAKYGPLRNVWVARNPPGFAFVEFEDARDAEDSVRGLDGTRVCGQRVRVEMSSGQSRSGDRDGGGGSGHGRGGRGGGFGGDRGQRRSRSRSRS